MSLTEVKEFEAAVAQCSQRDAIGVADEWGYRTRVDFAHLGHAVQEAVAHSNLQTGGEAPWRLHALELDVDSQRWEIWGGQSGPAEPVRIEFEDHTALEVPSGTLPGPGLDTGPALLEPITKSELAGIELVLAELWRAIDNDALSETQQHQIIAMATLLKGEQQATEPGTTERAGLVGTLRAVLRFFLQEFPADVLVWTRLVELLDGIGWSTIAASLPH